MSAFRPPHWEASVSQEDGASACRRDAHACSCQRIEDTHSRCARPVGPRGPGSSWPGKWCSVRKGWHREMPFLAKPGGLLGPTIRANGIIYMINHSMAPLMPHAKTRRASGGQAGRRGVCGPMG